MFKKNDYGFKFEIGDVVKHVAQSTKNESLLRSECRYFIVERELQECSGGIQRHYCARAILIGGVGAQETQIRRYNEIELVKSEKFK